MKNPDLICKKFNESYPIGTEVEYNPIKGESNHIITRTKAKASVLGGHTPVIWLEDVSGCVDLDFISTLTAGG